MAAGLRPWLIGFTLNQAFRRSTLEQLGGFDERLGAGAPDFPSSAEYGHQLPIPPLRGDRGARTGRRRDT